MVVLAHLLLINGFEVAWQTLGYHRVRYRVVFLHALRAVSIYEAEVFEGLRVCRLEVKVRWDVPTQPLVSQQSIS